MLNVKEAVYLHYGIKVEVFNPDEIISSNHMQSRGYLTCPYCGDIKSVNKCHEGKSRFVVMAKGNLVHGCL